ncbi:hypothetical protein QA648_30655 (plasmid) [Rhizobium sp. CB3171]|uniref:hypothetical protein n=1 Tax=unclassified Rhizobium TaxID=2613769 RepID=UPI000CF203FE|nr:MULTISPECIES: hypothetical protein [Rhizobium]UWU24164.1 hypothetical protein N2601_28485 [Rhizobium tropici]WFU05093.1 hypothetical protein QA648_30655 [Rhizobium sp. CB3171]
MWAILLGAILVIVGLLYLFREALGGRLSEPYRSLQGNETLEPQGQGIRFLGVSRNWPGLLIIAVGVLLLVFGGYL